MKFTEAVRWYSEEKKARGLSPVVNAKEINKYLDIINFYGNNSKPQGINNNNLNPYNDIKFPSDS